MKYITDQYIVEQISFNEDEKSDKKLLKSLKEPSYTTIPSFSDKIKAVIQRVIKTIMLRFGPKAKLTAQELMLKNKIAQLDSVKLKAPIEVEGLYPMQLNGKIQKSFEYILSGMNGIADVFKNGNFEENKKYCTNDIAILYFLQSLALETASRTIGELNHKVSGDYNKSVVLGSEKYVIKSKSVFDKEDTLTGIKTKKISYSSTADIKKRCMDTLVFISNLKKQMDLSTKQLKAIEAKFAAIETSDNNESYNPSICINYVMEFNNFISVVEQISNKLLTECVQLIDKATASTVTTESAKVYGQFCTVSII